MRCVAERVVGEVVVLDVATRAGLGEVSTEVTDRVRERLGEGRRAFLLNLAGVASLDSHGLGDLIGAYRAASKEGATLKLLGVHERVDYPLRVMNLSKSFERFDDEAEALRSFESSPPATSP